MDKCKRIFVTGTDTGVGKTLISSALLHYYRERGVKAAGYKPVAAGCEVTDAGLRNDDAMQLHANSMAGLRYEDINPVALLPPIAPSIAARQMGQTVSVANLSAGADSLSQGLQRLVIEGAGGWKVPLNDKETFDALAVKQQAAVILVVGLRLGCINHGLLTADAIVASGLQLVGWVANVIDPDMPFVEENILELRQRIQAPLLGTIPYQSEPSAAKVSGYFLLTEHF